MYCVLDKLRKGRKDGGTPEKPSTPNASEVEEEQPPPVLVNDEILALQIKPEDLAQVSVVMVRSSRIPNILTEARCH